MNGAIPLGIATVLAILVAWLSIRMARDAIHSQPRQSLERLREETGSEPGVPQEFSILVEEVRASLESRAYYSRVMAKRVRKILATRHPDMPEDRLPPGLRKLLAAQGAADANPSAHPRARKERVSARELESIIKELEEL